MSYLGDYGVKDARREKLVKRLAIAAIVLLIAAIALYFQFRDYREQKQISRFIELLRAKDYKAAHALWGCTDAKPCRHYDFDKFMEDWGPQSPQANIEAAKIATKKSCDKGIIQFLEFPGNREVQLWVEREDGFIGFAPWPICNPRMKVPAKAQ
jgi:hypothetical protein